MKPCMLLLTGAALVVLAACNKPRTADGHAAADMSSMPMSAATPDTGMAQLNMRMSMPPMPAVYGGQADKAGAPVFKDLGAHKHPISTKVPKTQMYFDQGVNLLFGFNHAEAIRSFREAARLDPECAMCWWGVAFALGPNINLGMQPDAVAPAWEALARAQALAPKASPIERQWIAALASRYARDPKADRKPLDEGFAQAMGKLWREHPEDLDAGTFYAEALMDTQPWDYWLGDGRSPKGHGGEIVQVLEQVIKRAPDHPGALHLYIHAVEASTTPQRAESAADRLTRLMPDAGHVVHMPSHIFYRVGRYADAAHANELAAKVDEQYIAACKAQGFYPAGYYGHNIHFLWTSAEMEGRYKTSIDAARRLVKAVDAVNVARQMPQGELYVFTPVATYLRFGKWDEILAEPAPPRELKLDTAVWLYARIMALANTGDLKGARLKREELAALTKGDFKGYDAVALPARSLIQLAVALSDGEIARLSGEVNKAVVSFEYAQKLEQALPYMEPPYWHQPTAHLLGAALLQANRAAEAERVYRESLKTYRLDGWSLFGLAQALDAQGKKAEAAQVRRQFDQVWKLADVQLTSSRF
jgi:tetratricopeptide (TPR) repeat protein